MQILKKARWMGWHIFQSPPKHARHSGCQIEDITSGEYNGGCMQ